MSQQNADEDTPEEEAAIKYFVEKFGLTPLEAREVVKEHGSDTTKAEEMVQGHRKRGG